ncbi:MAG TPA: SPOR domain-containing protein [Symbiobacteriaceae bacterium]|nr:SPOR domain-containing protein [Symbiobacteriaceae bacterium]
MHQRFGRPAQQKIKDRWGGGFILATILALLAAWFAGDSIGKWINGRNAAETGNPKGTPGIGSAVTAEPGDFDLRFIQVGAFRSKANYMNAVNDMNTAGLSPVVGATKNNVTPVYVGPFATKEEAETAKARVQALKKDYEKATIREMAVKYNPEAVPAAATGMTTSDMRKGMDLLNTYLQEVKMWLENPGADTAALAESGKGLSDLAAALSDSKDARVKELANMASTASANATTLDALSTASPTDGEYQAAMAQYMTLVDQYMAFQAGK